jgi:acetyl-CoA acetyltransferase
VTAELPGAAAIVGIGATEFSKRSGRTELQLACEATLAALRDCGLEPGDVDGLVTFVMDSTLEIELARSLGIGELTFFSRIHYGGGAPCATVQQAAMAIATGVAGVVVCYRAFNERSETRFGAGAQDLPLQPPQWGNWYSPHGLLTPAAWVALFAQRYLYETGASTEDFGRIAVIDRANAARNPAAWFYERPITLEDHQQSRWIAEPLRLLDCCQETDGGQAFVIVSAQNARSLPHPPAVIEAAAQGSGADQHEMNSYYRERITGIPEMGLVARQLWEQSGLGPDRMDAAILYDHFTPLVLMQLEELGFCGPGEAKEFIAGGQLDPGGTMPLNTHGGQLGEAYLHGMNGIAEAVRLIRGSSFNQPAHEVEHVVVTGGTAVPTSGCVLGR